MDEETRQYYINRLTLLAQRIIKIESQNPNSILMSVNPFQLNNAILDLRDMGFKKPFLANSKQYLASTFLSYERATIMLLRFSLLSGITDGNGHIHCWNGVGEYLGWQGLFQLRDFTSGKKENKILIVDLGPVFNLFEDLLDPIKS